LQFNALIDEANRQLTICNACRYCEGYCAVFPALERRIEVDGPDVLYLANLCHDCRACYYACPFTDPHEFAIDLPRTLSEVRRVTYARYSPIDVIRRLTTSGPKSLIVVPAVALLVLVAAVALTTGMSTLGFAHVGPGAFYEIVPWLLMVVPGTALALYVLVALTVGSIRFARASGGRLSEFLDRGALLTAGWEALTLRWLKGGDEGCHYPEYRTSAARTTLHTLVAGGFVAAFVSTVIAGLYQDVLGLLPPYALLSPPVVVGAVGGLAMVVGSAGLLVLKRRSDRRLTSEELVEFDVAFLVTIGLTSLTGMLLLAFRDTAAMPMLLLVHLAILTTLYVTAPYGKFAHFVYRYAALVRNRIEESGLAERPRS
jgi:citrate/tricarballylate utilization protein